MGKRTWMLRLAALLLAVAGIAFWKGDGTAYAAVGLSMDYLNEEINISVSGPGVSVSLSGIFVSTDKEKNWDKIEDLTKVAGRNEYTGTFPVSSVLARKPVNVYFRQNLTDTSTVIELKGLDSVIKGKMGLLASGSVITVTGVPSGRKVEYRTGNAPVWKDLDGRNGTFASASDGSAGLMVDKYTITGMTITFRLKATKQDRVSKEIKVKVPKKAKAPNIKVDGTKLMMSGLKPGKTEYRLKDTDPYVAAKEKTVALSQLFPVVKISSGTTTTSTTPSGISQAGISAPVTGGSVEVRTAATEKKPESKSKYVIVPSQEVFTTGADKVKIGTISKRNASQAAITITDASKNTPYEYTLLPANATQVELGTQKWVAVTKPTQMAIKKVKDVTPDSGVLLLVRKKSVTDKTTKVTAPASTCYQVKL